MSNVFVSYSRQSENEARRIGDDIEGLGHTVWYDDKLTGGQVWWDQILAKISDCGVFVLVLDPASLESTACTREFGYAADLGKPILPILVSDQVSTDLLPRTLLQIQYVDYRKRDQAAAFALAKALADAPPPGPPPESLPAPPAVPVSYIGDLSQRVDRDTLSPEEQSLLVVDLKEALGDPKSSDDARRLLHKLRRRRDVFASVAKGIDEALGTARPSVLKSLGTMATILVGAVVAWQVLPIGSRQSEPGTSTGPAVPTANLSANPLSVSADGTVTLTWETTNATDVRIEPLGVVATSGVREVQPAENTTYQIVARGDGGTVRESVLVTVTPPPPPIELTTSEARVQGERLAAQWFDALQRRDTDVIVEMSEAPFWNDNEMLTSLNQLGSSLETLFEERATDPAGEQEFQALTIDRFETWTIPEYTAAGFAEGDRIIGRLTLDDDDIVVAIIISGEGIVLFFRNANGELSLVGVWD